MSHPPSLLGPAREQARRGEISVHDHVCGIYDGPDEQYTPACVFLKVGLARGEQCLYIAEHLSEVEFLSILQTHGVDVEERTKSGALQVVSGKNMRLALGGFTPSAMIAFLIKAEGIALAGGFGGFRWAADMAWLRQEGIQPADLFSFEVELNTLLREHKLVALCQFSAEYFPPELLVAAAETHPLLVYNDLVCDNFYYVPPEEQMAPASSKTKLQRMLYNIISRERLMQSLLSDDSVQPKLDIHPPT